MCVWKGGGCGLNFERLATCAAFEKKQDLLSKQVCPTVTNASPYLDVSSCPEVLIAIAVVAAAQQRNIDDFDCLVSFASQSVLPFVVGSVVVVLLAEQHIGETRLLL